MGDRERVTAFGQILDMGEKIPFFFQCILWWTVKTALTTVFPEIIEKKNFVLPTTPFVKVQTHS